MLKSVQFPGFLFETKHVIEILEVLSTSVFIIMYLVFVYYTTVVLIYVVLIILAQVVEVHILDIPYTQIIDVRCQYFNVLKVSVDAFIRTFYPCD